MGRCSIRRTFRFLFPLRNGTAVVNCGRGFGCAAKGYIRPCVGFTTGGLEVVWRWPRWCCKSSCHSAMSISTAFIASTWLLQSPAPERRRRSFPRRTPATTGTTAIARFALRSTSRRAHSCRRRRNCQYRSFLDRSSIATASRSSSTRRGARRSNHALLQSPDGLLLILLPCRALFCTGDARKIECGRLLHIATCRDGAAAASR
jgi:hypothetical protein